MRLAVFTSHPIQYQAPVWKHLSGLDGISLKVFFASDFSIKGYRDRGFGETFRWDQPLLHGYDCSVLGRGVKGGFFSLPTKGLEAALRGFGPDVVLLCGYFPKFYVDALLAARNLGARLLLRAEMTDVDRSRGPLGKIAKDAYVRFFYTRVDRVLAIGINARNHLLRCGVSKRQIDFAGYNVDDELFRRQLGEFTPSRSRLRSEAGIGAGDFVFLVCGKLIKKKNPLLAVRAYKRLPVEVRRRCRLIFLGDGELRKAVELEARATKGVTVTGFVNQGELGKYYAMADCALLTSSFRETWGLVVNEAMIFGLAVIASSRVGCVTDLVDEKTGRVFPSGDEEALERTMREVIPWVQAERHRIAKAAQKRVAGYSAAHAAEAIARSAVSAVSGV